MGYVYLIGQSDTKNIYKIGLTTGNIENRIKKLQTGNSEELYIHKFYKTDAPFKLEKMLHNHFREKHYLNEWYELSKEDQDNFINVCEFYQHNINVLKNNPFFKKC